MCFMDIEKAIDRVLKKVLEWSMKKKKYLISWFDKTRFRVDAELSEELVDKVGMPQGSVLSSFLPVVVDIFTEFARQGALIELLYADVPF